MTSGCGSSSARQSHHDVSTLPDLLSLDDTAHVECKLPGCHKFCSREGHNDFCGKRHAAANRIRILGKSDSECCLPECRRERFTESRPPSPLLAPFAADDSDSDPWAVTGQLEHLAIQSSGPQAEVSSSLPQADPLLSAVCRQQAQRSHTHGYCCLSHFNEAVRRGICRAPGCNGLVHIDNNGTVRQRVHEYCSRTCSMQKERKEVLELLRSAAGTDGRKATLRKLLENPMHHPVMDAATGEKTSRCLDVHMGVFQYSEDLLKKLMERQPFWTENPSAYGGLTNDRWRWRTSGKAEACGGGLMKQCLTSELPLQRSATPWKMYWYYLVQKPALIIAYVDLKKKIRSSSSSKRHRQSSD